MLKLAHCMHLRASVEQQDGTQAFRLQSVQVAKPPPWVETTPEGWSAQRAARPGQAQRRGVAHLRACVAQAPPEEGTAPAVARAAVRPRYDRPPVLGGDRQHRRASAEAEERPELLLDGIDVEGFVLPELRGSNQ